MACKFEYNGELYTEQELQKFYAENLYPQHGDIIEIDAIEYRVHTSPKYASDILAKRIEEGDLFFDEDGDGEEIRSTLDDIPVYNLDPLGDDTVLQGGIQPIFNIPLFDLLKMPGYMKTGKKFDTKKYANTFGGMKADDLPFQLEGQRQSKASQATIAQMKEFLKRIGVDYQKVSEIVVGGKKVGAAGVARIMQNLVEVVDGKEDQALTEEAMHFAVELIEQYNPTLYKQMFNGIGNYGIFRDTLSLYRTTYVKDGKPDIPRIKKEAIAKLLAEHIINQAEGTTDHPDLLEKVDSWWQKFKEWFSRLLSKTDYNPFREAAKELLIPQEFYQMAPQATLQKANEDLDKLLIDYLKPFGVTFRTLETIKTKLGTDALGVTDVVNKLISVTNNRNIETMPEEVGHMITFLMGQQHPLMKELFNYIPNWSEYERVKKQYDPEYNNEKQVQIEAIGQLLAKAFVKNYTGAKEAKGLLDKVIDWLKNFFLGDFGDSYPTKIADKIALQILAGKTDLIDNSINSNLRPLNFDKALAANPLATRIKNKFTTGKFSDFKITGSLAIAKQGLIYRDENESIHDVDFIANGNDERLAELNREMEAIGAVPIHAGWKHDNFVTYSYIVPKEGERVENVERDARNWIRSYTVGAKTYKYTDTSSDAMAVDFFWYPKESGENYFEDVSSFADVFKGKLFLSPKKSVERMYQRPKDQKDFVLFQPSYIGKSDEAFLYYQINPQSTSASQTTNTKAQEVIAKLKEKIRAWAVKKVIDDKAIEEDDRNYYSAKRGDKVVRPSRTTEWAKEENMRRHGGRDFLAGATDKMKALWAQYAMSGTNLHADAENIIKDATNADGQLLPSDQIKQTKLPKTADPVYSALREFLLGNPSKGVESFLGQFPQGSVFLTEQVVYNEKAGKEGRAGTIDLMVIQPDGKIKVYDWKSMGFKEGKTDQAFQKRSQHALQLTDYRKTLAEAYGEKNVELFTIPIAAYYSKDEKNKDKVTLNSIRIGDMNFRNETDTFLLPVVPEDQSTGNPVVDDLVRSLRALYKRLYAKATTPDMKWEKDLKLNQLAAAIRNLQVALNFEPIAAEAKNFIENIEQTLKKYGDSSNLPKEEQRKLLDELIHLDKAASTYSSIDQAFISEYTSENLSEDKQKILKNLQAVASTVKASREKIQEKISEYVLVTAEKHGIEGILGTEKEVRGIINSILEATTLPLRSANLLAKLVLEAKSRDNIVVSEQVNEFGELYQNLVREAGSDKAAMEAIGDPKTLKLKRKVKPAFWEMMKKAREEEDAKTILANIDITKYKQLLKDMITKKKERIEQTNYTTVQSDNERMRANKIAELEKFLNIQHKDFMGWNDRDFKNLIKESIEEEKHYSDEYKALRPAAKKMWEFITELNRKAFSLGYLGDGDNMAFLPLVQGTIIERLSQASNHLSEIGEVWKDLYTVAAHEEQAFAKTDPETNKPIKTIPKLFKRSNNTADQLSHDLLKIMPLYIRALQEYGTAKDLELDALAIHAVEKAKGHFELEVGTNRVIFMGGHPKVFPGNETNAAIVEALYDDAIYGIKDDSTSVDSALDKVTKGDEEQKEKTRLSVKKGFQNANMLTQALAVGLKLLVAIPNYVGSGMQAAINAGRYFTFSEYMANHGRVIKSIFEGEEGNIMKGLMDMIIPLNEDVVHEKQRELAWKQSPLKWLGTWTFNDVLMSSNKYPDVAHQLTNAYSWVRNTMVEDGKLVNIRQYLKNQDIRDGKYSNKTPAQIRELEKSFDSRVDKLQETRALHKIAKFNDKGILEIPGVSREEVAAYRTRVVEFGRKITSQMSNENKAQARRNILIRSFMMFKNWIPKQVTIRAVDLRKDPIQGEWEYGRARLFFKTLHHLGMRNITDMRDIITATPKGLQIMRDILEQKREDHYKKTGQILTITDEEFFELMRTEIRNQMKELAIIMGLAAMVLTTKMAAPDDDEDPATVNRYKFLAKAANKISDELFFYYIPTSAESITNGSIFPSLSLLTKATKFMNAFTKEGVGIATDNEEWTEEAKPLKYFINMIPIAAQWQNEILPYYDPEEAKERGVRVSAEARAMR